MRGQLAEVDLGVADGHDPGALQRVHVPAPRACRARPPRARPRGRPAGSRAAPAPCRGGSRGASACGPSSRALPSMRCSTSLGGHLHLDAHPRLGQLGDGRREGAWHGLGAANLRAAGDRVRHDTVPPDAAAPTPPSPDVRAARRRRGHHTRPAGTTQRGPAQILPAVTTDARTHSGLRWRGA